MRVIVFSKAYNWPHIFPKIFYQNTIQRKKSWSIFPVVLHKEMTKNVIDNERHLIGGYGPLFIVGYTKDIYNIAKELKYAKIPIRAIITVDLYRKPLYNLNIPIVNIRTKEKAMSPKKIVDIFVETYYNNIEDDPNYGLILEDICKKYS